MPQNPCSPSNRPRTETLSAVDMRQRIGEGVARGYCWRAPSDRLPAGSGWEPNPLGTYCTRPRSVARCHRAEWVVTLADHRAAVQPAGGRCRGRSPPPDISMAPVLGRRRASLMFSRHIADHRQPHEQERRRQPRVWAGLSHDGGLRSAADDLVGPRWHRRGGGRHGEHRRHRNGREQAGRGVPGPAHRVPVGGDAVDGAEVGRRGGGPRRTTITARYTAP